MVLPDPFTTAQPAIVTFDFTDFASGTGIQTFFGCLSNNTTPVTFLNENLITGSTTNIFMNHNSTKEFDLTPFNISQTVKGTAYVEFYIGSTTNTATFTIGIEHYDGSTVTSLGSATATSTAQTGPIKRSLVIPLTTKNFKVGDILRLKVSVTNSTSSGNNKIWVSDANPLKSFIPFKIQL